MGLFCGPKNGTAKMQFFGVPAGVSDQKWGRSAGASINDFEFTELEDGCFQDCNDKPNQESVCQNSEEMDFKLTK